MEFIEEFTDQVGNKWRKSRTELGSEVNEMIFNKKEEEEKLKLQKQNENANKVIEAENRFDKDVILNSALDESLKKVLIRRFKL